MGRKGKEQGGEGMGEP